MQFLFFFFFFSYSVVVLFGLMLAVASLPNAATRDESQEQMESFSNEDFPDLLESIDFNDLFVGIHDGDVLPDLEMDPDILADFSVSGSGEESEMNTSVSNDQKVEINPRKDEEDKVSGSGSGLDSSLSTRSEEIVSKRDESVVVNPVSKENDKGRKSTQAKNNQGKRKVKVIRIPVYY